MKNGRYQEFFRRERNRSVFFNNRLTSIYEKKYFEIFLELLFGLWFKVIAKMIIQSE